MVLIHFGRAYRQTSAPPLPFGGSAEEKWKRTVIGHSEKRTKRNELMQTEPCVSTATIRLKDWTATSGMKKKRVCVGGGWTGVWIARLWFSCGALVSQCVVGTEWGSPATLPPTTHSSSEPADVSAHFLQSVQPVSHYPHLFVSLKETHILYMYVNRYDVKAKISSCPHKQSANTLTERNRAEWTNSKVHSLHSPHRYPC